METISRTPKQTPHFDTKSEITPYRTLVQNEIMKTFKSAQHIYRKSWEKMHIITHAYNTTNNIRSNNLDPDIKRADQIQIIRDITLQIIIKTQTHILKECPHLKITT